MKRLIIQFNQSSVDPLTKRTNLYSNNVYFFSLTMIYSSLCQFHDLGFFFNSKPPPTIVEITYFSFSVVFNFFILHIECMPINIGLVQLQKKKTYSKDISHSLQHKTLMATSQFIDSNIKINSRKESNIKANNEV